MNRPNIYFWQPVLTDHVAYTYKELAASLNMDAMCISDREELAERKKQGWNKAREVIPQVVLDSVKWQSQINNIAERAKGDVHIFGSPFERCRINTALDLMIKNKKEVYFVSEPYSPVTSSYFGQSNLFVDTFKSLARPYLYNYYGYKYKNSVNGVFAISPLAVKQFSSMGFSDKNIYPFGYFVPSICNRSAVNTKSKKRLGLRIAFVGSLIPRKGLAVACQAMRQIKYPATLDIFGPGDASAIIPISANIQYKGVIDFGRTETVLSNYDLLVVPSEHDGWAVVVNEAVQAGTVVLASSATGASAMIDRWKCGMTFSPGDYNALANCIDKLSGDPEILRNMKQQCEKLKLVITPLRAGRYMAECIKSAMAGSSPPFCPWY